MTKRRPPKVERDPPWMRLGPAADEPEAGDDGERLWKKIAEGVTPLGKTKHRRHALPSPLEGDAARAKRSRVQAEGAAPKQGGGGASAHSTFARKPGRSGSPSPLIPSAPPPLAPGRFAGLDRNSGDKLRKGKMPVDAKLDLHGMTQQQAHGAVTRFIAAQQAAGARCVIIVTGKGGKSDDPFAPKSAANRFTFSAGRGVLKDALPRWLNEPGLRAHIVAVSEARPNHGGAGAVYVLLKRKR